MKNMYQRAFYGTVGVATGVAVGYATLNPVLGITAGYATYIGLSDVVQGSISLHAALNTNPLDKSASAFALNSLLSFINIGLGAVTAICVLAFTAAPIACALGAGVAAYALLEIGEKLILRHIKALDTTFSKNEFVPVLF